MSPQHPDEIRARSIDMLRQVSVLLRSLADDLEEAVDPARGVDADEVARVAEDLQHNHRTLRLLGEVHANVDQIRPRLN
jgi:hypothetical protein